MLNAFIFVASISLALILLFVLVFLLSLEHRERKLNRQIDELLSQDVYNPKSNVINIYDHRGNKKSKPL